MAFIRVKTIPTKKGSKYQYAYLVNNRYSRKTKKVCQKVISYLGRVYRFPKVIDTNTNPAPNPGVSELGEKPFPEMLAGLFQQELANHGFRQAGDEWSNEGLLIRFEEKTMVFSRGKRPLNAVIMMNEGFFCKNTHDALMHFKGTGTEADIGSQLANALLGAGLKVSNELFVALVEKFI